VGKFKEDEVIKLNLDTRVVILEGIKRINDPKGCKKDLARRMMSLNQLRMLLSSFPLCLFQ